MTPKPTLEDLARAIAAQDAAMASAAELARRIPTCVALPESALAELTFATEPRACGELTTVRGIRA